MQQYIDLHTHSTASDGSMSPRELVRHAKHSGLTAIALTDHDTISGIEEALDEARSIGFEVIPGLEISCDFKPELHMLAYFLQDNYMKMKDILEDLRENREQRNPKIVAKLNEMGFNITMDEIRAEAGGDIVGRPHIAKVLMKKGYVESIHQAFEEYLAGGRPAYFKRDRLTPEQGIEEIRKAGGIPVLAHPIHLGMDYAQLDELLGELVPKGLMGMEVYYVDNTEEDTQHLERLAKKHNLLATGGSDYHGTFKPEINIGTGFGNLKVPYELLDKIRLTIKSSM